MSGNFQERMEALKGVSKLSYFEYEQLLCLKEIADKLLSIEDSLDKINGHLANIEVK